MANTDRTDPMAESDPHRLPTAARPTHYRLELAPDLEAATFTGTVDITLEVDEPVESLVCNAAELRIDEATLTGPDGVERALSPALDPDVERLTMGDGDPIAAGPSILSISFAGTLNDKLTGFYRSTYEADDGSERTIATTQFEATHARKAFPCWDEPAFKATFGVSLIVAADHLAVSNGRELRSEPTDDGRRRVTFADTMSMSTYLVAFVVGPMAATPPVDVNGTPVRIVHPLGKGNLTDFGLEVATFALTWFERYYGIDYPGDKLDLVAVPDFAFGAMENLGCVTFREVLVLVDPQVATRAELERLTDVVCHELAHMWFGDLVTMRWWEGIWLNEAFATFMEVSATDAFRPEWKRWESFGREKARAFDIDALTTTRPIEYPVVSPDDAEGMFDVLTYEKGAAVVRMLEQHLGADRFAEGIRSYLQTYAYGNTETTDLWDAIESATGDPARRIMDTWIYQAGHPAVAARPSADGQRIELRQTVMRYLPDQSAPTQWAIPVRLRYEQDGDQVTISHLLEGPADTIELDSPLVPESLVVNADAVGFYRVHRSADELAMSTARLADLSAVERFALLDDAWAQAVQGSLDTTAILRLVRAFGSEGDPSVWTRVLGAMSSLDRLVVDPDPRGQLHSSYRDLLLPALEEVGPEPRPGEDELDRELRGSLLTALGIYGDDRARQRAEQLYAQYVDERSSVDPSLATAALTVVAHFADEARFDHLVERYRAATEPQEAIRFLYALTEPLDPELIRRCCSMTLTDDVRTQNAPYVLGRALAHRDHGPMVWSFVRDHWDEANDRFPSNSLVRMLEGLQRMTDRRAADDAEQFFADHPIPQGDKTLAQHLERMHINIDLFSRSNEALESELRAS